MKPVRTDRWMWRAIRTPTSRRQQLSRPSSSLRLPHSERRRLGTVGASASGLAGGRSECKGVMRPQICSSGWPMQARRARIAADEHADLSRPCSSFTLTARLSVVA